jgi:putative regulator of septum formation
VPNTDDDIAPVFQLDEDFIRGAQFKEPSARQRARQSKRQERPPRPPRRRGLSIGDWRGPVLLVLVVLGLCWVLKVGVFTRHGSSNRPEVVSAAPGTDPAGVTTSTTFRLLGVDFRIGNCVIWDQAGSSDRYPRIVPCDQPHLIEITGRVDLFDKTAFPTDADFDTIRDQDCTRLADEFLGHPLDRHGRFQASSITPYPEAWVQGEKTVWCGLIVTPHDVDDDRYIHEAFTGTVKGQDQTYLWGAGSCLADDETWKIVGAVPCDQPHAYEVTGHVDASGFRIGPPAADSNAWNTGLGTACATVARGYLKGPIPAGFLSGVLPFQADSWTAGRRLAECVLSRPNSTGHATKLLTPLRPTL